jgi:hypothetical protein
MINLVAIYANLRDGVAGPQPIGFSAPDQCAIRANRQVERPRLGCIGEYLWQIGIQKGLATAEVHSPNAEAFCLTQRVEYDIGRQ